MVHEESFRKEPFGKLFPRPPKIREYVAESLTTLYGFRPSHISFQCKTQRPQKILLVYNISTNFKYQPVFFYSMNGPCTLCAWAINPSEKNSVRNMHSGPRTRLVRGISCSPNFPRTSIPRCTHAKHGPILYYNIACVLALYKSY